MKKDYKKTDAGVKYFEVTLSEMINKLNGLGICDSCSTPMKKRLFSTCSKLRTM